MTDRGFDPDNTLAGGLFSLSPRETIELGIDICAAVETAYGASGVHGGIWPGNVSVYDGRVFIGPKSELGVKEMSPDALEYIAPEQFWSGENTPAADVYAIGLIMYTALNDGEMPFFDSVEPGSEVRAQALQSRMRGKNVPYPKKAGRELGDVVLKAISFHREERYACPSELRQALLDLSEGAAVPAAVPVIPLTQDEVKSARSYKVDKEFEDIEPEKQPKPKKERAKKEKPEEEAPEADPIKKREKQREELENFRNPRKKPTWLIGAAVVVVVAVGLALGIRGCVLKNIENKLPVESEPAQTETLPEASPGITPEATPEATPEPTPEATPEPKEPTYEVHIEDVTWEQAKARCEELGGHLATVKSDAELQNVIAAVEAAGARYIWLGAQRNADGEWYYVTGEPMSYGVWDTNEPSAYDGDGTPENYLLMWKSASRGIWCFNDTRNDPISVLPKTYSGRTAFVCQFD